MYMRKSFVISILISFFSLLVQAQIQPSFSWQQRGNDIEGERAGDVAGQAVDLNHAGNIMVLGATSNDDNGTNSGHARIFQWNGAAWNQLGNDIDGVNNGDLSGRGLSLDSAGTTVAIGATNHQNDGHVRIFEWNGVAWVQKGMDIDGLSNSDDFGISVSLSADGNTVIIGDRNNFFGGPGRGAAHVFEWNGASWAQKGGTIYGEFSGDNCGESVDISYDGNIIVIGARLNDGNGTSSGHIRIYEWDGNNWSQMGNDIDGESVGSDAGISSAISADGHTVALGGRRNDGGMGPGAEAGHARVYEWNGNTWVQKGADIDGESAGDRSGRRIDLSADGNYIVIGARWSADSGTKAGHVRTFEWDGGSWVQLGADIDGVAAFDEFGEAVAINHNGSVICGTAHLNDGNGNNAGHARIFYGCPLRLTHQITACGSYQWIDGNTYTSSNNSAFVLRPNANGCDTVITLNLTINQPSPMTNIQENGCDSFTWSANGQTYYQGGTFDVTLSNQYGCDSMVRLNLSLGAASSGSSTVTACDSFTWALNGQTYYSTGARAYTTTNASGCDSVATYGIFINQSKHVTIDTAACSPFLWDANGQSYSQAGTYFANFTGSNNCDSVMMLNLTLLEDSSTQVESACQSYFWNLNGQTYTSSGQYQQVLTNAFGCDSLITLDLSITSIDTGVGLSNGILTAFEGRPGTNHQWLDCDNGYAVIAGETDRNFTPTATGNYAVEISFNGCIDTSGCRIVTTVGKTQIAEEIGVSAFPNPTNGNVTIKLPNANQEAEIKLFDFLGKQLSQTRSESSTVQLKLEQTAGIYFLEVSLEDGRKTTIKLVKQ